MSETKEIMVIAQSRKIEALRMATGLTLLDDHVTVDVIGDLEEDAATAEQLDALDFADVPVRRGAEEDLSALVQAMVNADAVFIV